MKRIRFTLVELLVVVAVILILISILLPALRSAKDYATTIDCTGKERQVAVSLYNYSADNDNYLPYVGWRKDLVANNYLPGGTTNSGEKASLNFRCPIDNAERPSDSRFVRRASYVGNIGWKPVTDPDWTPQTPTPSLGMFPAHAESAYVRIDAARYPSRTILFMEQYGYTNYLRIVDGDWQDSGSRTRGWSAFDGSIKYHRNRVNFAFSDGHVSLLRWTDTYPSTVTNKSGIPGTGNDSLWVRR